jgi:site-specific recombinase XerD
MDLFTDNPARYLHVSKHKDVNEINKARALTDDEVKAIINQTNKDNLKGYSERLYLLLSFNLGLRVSEVMKIQFRDIDLTNSTIKIFGKGSKTRVLGLNIVLLRELSEYLARYEFAQEDFVIQSSNGTLNTKPASRMHGSRVLKRYAEKANIDLSGVTTHSGRVTAINFLLDNDISLRDVANFAGHSSIDTTRIYDRKDEKRILQTCNIINFSDDE